MTGDNVAAFTDAMRGAGLEPPNVIEPGKLHRFPGAGKRSGSTAGWCKLFDDGAGGCFGDWSSGFSDHWQAKRENPLSEAEREAFKRHVAQAQAQAKAERTALQAEAAAKAARIWNAAAPAPKDHPYLVKKQCRAYGIKQEGNKLLIPMTDSAGKIWSLQAIDPAGGKLFTKDSKTKGMYFSIPGSDPIVICEGYATGASIHEATGYSVVVTFSCGNLEPVAKTLRAGLPDTRIIIAADSAPASTTAKARNTAQAIGADLAVPSVDSDFNDLAVAEGSEAVRHLIDVAEPIVWANDSEPRLQVVPTNLAGPIPTTRYVVEPILPRKNTTLNGGHGGVGKSQQGLVLTAHAACGKNWAGLQVIRCRSLYVSLEDPADLVRLRLRRIVAAYNLDPATIEAGVTIADGSDGASLAVEHVDCGVRRLLLTAAYDELQELAAGHGLIVIDNASDAYDADENSRRLVRAFVRSLNRIAREQDAAVLLLAHIDKNAAKYGANGNSYSGSTAWHNSVRSRLALIETEGRIELHHEKNNFGPRIEPIPLVWTDDGVLIPATHGASTQRATERDAADDAAVLAALQAAIADGESVSTARSGPATTLNILTKFPDLPDDLRKGNDRFWAALTRLERASSVVREEYRNSARHRRERWKCASRCARQLPPIPPEPTRARSGTSARVCASSELTQNQRELAQPEEASTNWRDQI